MRSLALTSLLILFLTFIYSCKKKDNRPDINLSNGLHIKDGKYLADACGNKVVLRGVNMGSIYAVDFGLKELEEIEKTGANSVRIVLEREYRDYSKGGLVTGLSPAKLENILSACLAKDMIPIVELHDFTGSGNINDLKKATQWWTKSDIKELLFKYQKSIILNIANEPDDGSANAEGYSNANITAITALREAGYTCPIMVDAPGWGKDHTFFLNKGQYLIDGDPLHNLIFSIHAYWPTNGANGNYSDANIIQSMNELKRSGLPIAVGELAVADIQGGLTYNINYRLLMRLCQQNEFGYLVWWWGFSNNPAANNQLSMTNDGLFTGLQGSGRVVAMDDENSIKKTSVRTCNNQ
jgi:mannan endo-1,4-beta-mannosidase